MIINVPKTITGNLSRCVKNEPETKATGATLICLEIQKRVMRERERGREREEREILVYLIRKVMNSTDGRKDGLLTLFKPKGLQILKLIYRFYL